MDPISPSAVSLAELVVTLVTTVGVGNFILIVAVLMLFINIPTIIGTIRQTVSSRREAKVATENQRLIGETQRTISDVVEVINSQTNDLEEYRGEIKALVAIVDTLHASIVKESEERRQENIMLSDALERQVRAIEAIDRMMRNVMSESDTMRVTAFVIGITNSLKSDIMAKVMAIIEGSENKSDSGGLYDLNLRTDMETAWSDIKTEIDRFKMPVKLRLFLDEYEKKLWSQTGLFTKIMSIAASNTIDAQKKQATISKQLDSGLRDLQNELAKYLQQVRAATRGD